jgi:hypothetical protein
LITAGLANEVRFGFGHEKVSSSSPRRLEQVGKRDGVRARDNGLEAILTERTLKGQK